MNQFHDIEYLNALREILMHGTLKGDRTGVGTTSRFGMQMRFDLSKGFPLLTTKRMAYKSMLWELLWFVRGETNNNWLNERGVTIWDEWTPEDGDLGPLYGFQWRHWGGKYKQFDDGRVMIDSGMDQLGQVIHTLKTNPNDRRMIVSAWNPPEIDKMALPPCHLLFQFWTGRGKLSCQMYQRSCDMFLGVPFNIASYSALVHMIAHIVDMEVGDFIWTGGDCHIYNNHHDQVQEQLSRPLRTSPTLRISPDAPKDIDGDWNIDHFILEDYNPNDRISAPVAV